jgi:hypothetical protein
MEQVKAEPFDALTGIMPHTEYEDIYNKDGRIGIYNKKDRKKLLQKYHKKRIGRKWRKKIRYGHVFGLARLLICPVVDILVGKIWLITEYV